MNPIYWLISKIHSFVALVAGGFCEFLYRIQAMVPMRVKLCIGFLLLGATSFAVSFASLPWVSWVADKLMALAEIVDLLVNTGFPQQYAILLFVSKVIGFACCVVAVLSLLPMRAVMYVQRVTWFAFAVMWLWLFTFVYSVPAWYNDFDYKVFDQESRNNAWIMF